MVLAMLRGADELITGARSLTDMETPARGTLERMAQLYRTQVLVDEAMGFSPLQLACMATLARPDTRSFFVGVDRLAKSHPDLFDKYLYVGATRAATYLGLTCEEHLPPSMGPLEGLFGQDWS